MGIMEYGNMGIRLCERSEAISDSNLNYYIKIATSSFVVLAKTNSFFNRLSEGKPLFTMFRRAGNRTIEQSNH